MDKYWKIQNKGEAAEILFYGDIGDSWEPDSITAKDFAKELQEIAPRDVVLRINSPGGSVFDAHAIYNVLKTYKGDVTAHIDGLCASAATVVACAAKKVIMPKNALFMIHDPACYAFDALKADDCRKTADMLDKIKDSILEIYLTKAGGKTSRDTISKLMENETWMTAEEAEAAGFIDEIDDYGIDAKDENGCAVVNGVTMRVSAACLVKLQRKGVKDMKEDSIMEKVKAALRELGFAKEETPAPIDEEAIAKAEETRKETLAAMKCGKAHADALVDAAIASGKTAEEIRPLFDAVADVAEAEPQIVEKKFVAVDEIEKLIRDQTGSGAEGVKAAPVLQKTETETSADSIVDFVNSVIRK